jgi:uncharacterized membrane protein YkvA (DUF1232 family)
MKSTNVSVPESLNRHLSASSSDDILGVAHYLERGAELVTPDAVRSLRGMKRPLQKKIAAISRSDRLQSRVEMLAVYFDEVVGDNAVRTQTHREAAFALLYFLKGFDRIPDSVPEVGLVDDAMIVELVLQRNAAALRGHWLRHGRVWPAEI